MGDSCVVFDKHFDPHSTHRSHGQCFQPSQGGSLQPIPPVFGFDIKLPQEDAVRLLSINEVTRMRVIFQCSEHRLIVLSEPMDHPALKFKQ